MFIAGKYDDNGKWMDGWETRRKRGEGYDYCVVQLAYPGVIHGIDIDTSHFTGNFPPAASIEACSVNGDRGSRRSGRKSLPATNLRGNSHHYVPVTNRQAWTHLRLNIFPDGGIARLRVYGEPVRDWSGVDRSADAGPRGTGEWRARPSPATTRTTGRPGTSSVPGAAWTWATAGRRGAGASPATTGPSWHSASAGAWSGSRSTPRTSRATTRIAARCRPPM